MRPVDDTPVLTPTMFGAESPAPGATLAATPAPPAGVSRRRVLQGGAAFVLGLHLPLSGRRALADDASGAAAAIRGPADAAFAPNAFVRITDDDTVTVIVKHTEMGQGPYTGLATLVAEEMDADWGQMRAESAPANAELYVNTLFGIQGTGGSTAMANSYEQMRGAGAAARAMLVAAAAETWGVNAADVTVERGRVRHPDGHESGFGALAALAAEQAVPAEPMLKDPQDFTLIGTDVPKLDTRAKTRGRAMYTLDVYRENMETVVVRHPPQFGATVASVDDAAAMRVNGVLAVRTIPQGVAVYASNTWAAMKGRDALIVEWDTSGAETRSSAAMMREWREAAATRATMIETRGDIDAAPGDGARTLEAVYEFPFLAHAPMEPLDGVIEWSDAGAEVWMGSQLQTADHGAIARTLGIDPSKVTLHTMFAGGSFGRRAQAGADFAAELAEVAKASDTGVPLKLMWTREDDVRGGRYRPLTVHHLKGALDADGNVSHWENTIATQSILAGTPFEAMVQDGIDATSHEGSSELPYDFPNLHVSLATMASGVPVLWWRSVGHTHTAYATETFLDELFEMGGKDPFDGRMALLDPESRDAGVLQAVKALVEEADDVPEGRARGVALHKSFGSYVAQVIEVSAADDGTPKVHRVWCAVDCGRAVNPNVVTAQIEGGVGFALGAILYDEITLDGEGRVQQGNFDDYRSLRIDEMPEVIVRVVDSDLPPSGIGEPGVPPVGPAFANAWRRLTGEAVRSLPFVKPGAQA